MRIFDYRMMVKAASIAVAVITLCDSGAALAQRNRLGFLPQPRQQQQQQNQPAQEPSDPTQVIPGPDLSTYSAQNEKPLGSFSPDDQFHELLNRAIEITSRRYLTASIHSPWRVFHSVLALRQDCKLRLTPQNNNLVNAIQWISTAEPQFAREPWMMLTPHGAKFHPYTVKYFFEGHPGQFLALLSQSDLPTTHEFRVQGKTVKLSDFINNTMKEVNDKEEVTWVLWALQHYLDSDAEWLNQKNEKWSIERLVQMETAAPVVGAPCGGNHRLFALTRARDKFLQSGGRLRGTWFQADQKIKQHIEIARSLQNNDGSFSGDWYKGPMYSKDTNQRFNTTGHIMEFLAISLPAERLHEPWVRNAVWMLSRELVIQQNTNIDCGPLFHSLDALILYRDRIRPNRTTAPLAPKSASPESAVPEQVAEAEPVRKPEPMPEKAPQVASAIPELKVSDSTASEDKPVAQEELPVPTPATESLEVPNPIQNPIEPNLETPEQPGAPTTPSISDPSQVEPGSPKLSSQNIEPIPQVVESKPVHKSKKKHGKSANSKLSPQDQSQDSAPGLLPDNSATPLSISSPILSNSKVEPKLTSSRDRISVWISRKSGSSGGCSEPHQTDAELEVIDEPASALDPANQSRGI